MTVTIEAQIDMLARMQIAEPSAYIVRVGWGGSRQVLSEPMPYTQTHDHAAQYRNGPDDDPNRATIEVVRIGDVERLYQSMMAELTLEEQEAVDARAEQLVAEARAGGGHWWDQR